VERRAVARLVVVASHYATRNVALLYILLLRARPASFQLRWWCIPLRYPLSITRCKSTSKLRNRGERNGATTVPEHTPPRAVGRWSCRPSFIPTLGHVQSPFLSGSMNTKARRRAAVVVSFLRVCKDVPEGCGRSKLGGVGAVRFPQLHQSSLVCCSPLDRRGRGAMRFFKGNDSEIGAN
jgi:hypothetical protein